MNTQLSESEGRDKRVHRLTATAWARRRRALLAVFAILSALALVPSVASAVTAPASDPFYTPPANLAQYLHGTILREREVAMSGPQQLETADAYQLMYRTTDTTGQPVAAVTTVMVPTSPPAGPRRLASYQMYYDSLTLNCAPSYTLQGGNNGGGLLRADWITELLQQGWDVNVRLRGPGQRVGGRSHARVRDARLDHRRRALCRRRAGRRPDGGELNGYSGGSEAATWAAALAPKYAPTLDIVGIAAGGNFPNLDYTTQYLDNSVWYGTEIGVLVSFNRALPQDFNLNQLLNAAGQALAAKDAQDGSGCGGSTLNEPYGNASQYTNFPDSEALADYAPVKRGLDRAQPEVRPAAEGTAVPLQLGER